MARAILLLVLFAVAACGTATQEAPNSLPLVTEVRWIDRPTIQASDYPASSFILGRSATIRMRCTANLDGRVTDCHALDDGGPSEFERGARAVLERGRIAPRSENGVPVESTFTTTIPFVVPEFRESPLFGGAEPDPEEVAQVRRTLQAQLEAGVPSLRLLASLTPEEREAFGPSLTRAFEDFQGDWLDATALAIARQAAAPSDVSAFDRAILIEARIYDRTREYFCAQHSCPDED